MDEWESSDSETYWMYRRRYGFGITGEVFQPYAVDNPDGHEAIAYHWQVCTPGALEWGYEENIFLALEIVDEVGKREAARFALLRAKRVG